MQHGVAAVCDMQSLTAFLRITQAVLVRGLLGFNGALCCHLMFVSISLAAALPISMYWRQGFSLTRKLYKLSV